jgi:TRAP-type C4-dicarboxylate transport system permease small subunit
MNPFLQLVLIVAVLVSFAVGALLVHAGWKWLQRRHPRLASALGAIGVALAIVYFLGGLVLVSMLNEASNVVASGACERGLDTWHCR